MNLKKRLGLVFIALVMGVVGFVGEVHSAPTRFGYSLFENSQGKFEPSKVIPVGPDYIVGPGDEFRLITWGTIDIGGDLVVDKEGNVFIPRVGIVNVSGVTFSAAQKLIQAAIAKLYKGFEINITMGNLRSIQVYVVGDAKSPGAYTVSSLATLVNALLVSGGPGPSGSLRDIQVIRNGRVLNHFDLYDLILRGDKTKDVRLMPEDVIFIPPSGPSVSISGSVKRPGIYEIVGRPTVADVVSLAGGFTDQVFKGRVQLRTITEGESQKGLELNYNDAKALGVNGGDEIVLFDILPDSKFVYLYGAVRRTGEYQYSESMPLSAYIGLSGGFTEFASNEIEISRTTTSSAGPLESRVMVKVDSGMEGVSLKSGDSIFVRPIPENMPRVTVKIGGEVGIPGSYPIQKGERLSSVIERAGGFTKFAYLKGAVFVRESVRDFQQTRLIESAQRIRLEYSVRSDGKEASAAAERFALQLEQAKATGRLVINIAGNMSEFKNSPFDIILENGDQLFVPQIPNSVQVIGCVYNQNAFVFDPSRRNAEAYIDMAGGYSRIANRDATYVIKANGAAMRAGQTTVEPGDTVVVPQSLEQIDWVKASLDISQILYNASLVSGVLFKLF